jgi:hypothetical protein
MIGRRIKSSVQPKGLLEDNIKSCLSAQASLIVALEWAAGEENYLESFVGERRSQRWLMRTN